MWLWMVIGLIILEGTVAQQVRVLNIGWLSNGNSTVVVDVPSFTSSLWIPLAVKHFNERSNAVLPLTDLVDPSCNVTLTLVGGIHNSDGSAKEAMYEFIAGSSDVDFVLGPVLSSTTVPVAVATSALNLPQLSFAATADELSDKVQYPTFFRVGPTDAQTGQATALLFQQFGYKRVGLICANNEFGLAIKTALENECQKLGIQVYVAETSTDLQGLKNQTYNALLSMKTLRLNVIVFATMQFDFMYWLGEAARELDWMIGKLYISHVQLSDYGTMNAEQIKRTYVFLNGSLDIEANADLSNPRFLNLLRVWPTFNASDINPYLPPRFQVPSNYFTLGQEQLAGRGWAWAYDSVVTLGLAACGASSSWITNMLNVNFQGTSGRVTFVTSTQDRNPDAFYYTMTNLLVFNLNVTAGGQPTVATLRGGGSYWNFSRAIGYNTGTTIPPRDSDPPINEIDSIPFGAKIYGWIGSGIAILCCIIAFGYLLGHRTERIVVESQPTYLGFLAVGCALIAASIIALTQESNAGCMGFPWLFSSGLTLAMASLTVKSARIALYWRHRGKISPFNRILGTKILPALMWLIVAVDLAIVLAWQLTAPWVLTMIVLTQDGFGNPLSSSLVCTSNSYSSTVFIGVLVAYMIFIALITGWVSFWVRNAPRRYHEARMTALAGVSMFQVFLMAAPAAYAVWQMALARFLVLSSMSFLLCMIVLCTMFAPKIFKVKFFGKMAAKTAASVKKDAEMKNVTFNGQSEQHIVRERRANEDPDTHAKPTDRSTYPTHRWNSSPARVTADWKLMILGIRSESEMGASHNQSDSDSPPDHVNGDTFTVKSPPEHERISPPETGSPTMSNSPTLSAMKRVIAQNNESDALNLV